MKKLIVHITLLFICISSAAQIDNDSIARLVNEQFEKVQVAEKHYNSAADFLSTGEPDSALVYFSKAISLYPQFELARVGRGNLYIDKDEIGKGITDLRIALELNPENFKIHFYLGKAFFLFEKYDESIAAYKECVEIKWDYAYAYNDMGSAFREKGDFANAIKNYSLALEIAPTLAYIYNNRGSCYREMKMYEHAIEDYDKAIDLDPLYALPYNNKGTCYFSLGDYLKAILEFDNAIEVDWTYAFAYNNRGYAMHKLEFHIEALKDFNDAITLEPEYGVAYFNRGICNLELMNKENTCEDWNRASELGIHSATQYLKTTCE